MKVMMFYGLNHLLQSQSSLAFTIVFGGAAGASYGDFRVVLEALGAALLGGFEESWASVLKKYTHRTPKK